MKKKILMTLLLLTLSSSSIFASDLNGVDTRASEPVITEGTNDSGVTSDQHLQDQENTAKAVGDLFGQAGVDQESIETAQEYIRPFAKIMNLIMAVILGITSLLMMFVSVLDLFYMAFPPVRDLLDGGGNGQQQMGRGRGSRGMGGMGMQQQQQPVGGGLSALGRWVSDEAIAASVDAQTPFKSMILSYLKKRSLFLLIFGVCVILFTSTVFSNLGIKIGIWIIGILSGF